MIFFVVMNLFFLTSDTYKRQEIWFKISLLAYHQEVEMSRILSSRLTSIRVENRLFSTGFCSAFCPFASASINSFHGGIGLSGETLCFLLSRLKP